MRIDGLQPALQQALLTALSTRTDRGRGEADGVAMPAPTTAPPPLLPNAVAQPTTTVQMLVTLASIDPIVERRRKAVVQADRGLSMLESLRDELAAGIAPPERLRELADWSQGFTLPDDPHMAELARDIELRVRVELAKHDLTA